MKRIILFIATNLAVVLVLSIVLKLFGFDRALAAQGLQYGQLLVYSLVVGFTGAIISLLMSKSIAKWTTGARVIDTPANDAEAWLLDTVRKLATAAGVAMPEVAVYDGAPNAFATGAFKNSAFVAVSTGLLQSMNREEVEAVLGHELSHVANGDMVTLTLIQGVVNTFVIFASRIVGSIVDRTVFRTERGSGPGYFITVIACQIVFGILASVIVAWFSRWREFRRRQRAASRTAADDPCADAPRWPRGRPTPAGAAGVRHLGRRRHDGALRIASADRGTHRGAEENPRRELI
jgi:heat shock protein HtpX